MHTRDFFCKATIMMVLQTGLILAASLTARGATPFVGGVIEYSQGTSGLYTSLALSADGYMNVSYYDSANACLKYASQVSAWPWWIVETCDASGNVGPFSSLAMDAEGDPHISYWRAGGLAYTHKLEGTWTLEIVDIAAAMGGSTSLALDEQGNPYIIYCDAAGGGCDLKYAYKSSGSWATATIDTMGEYVGQEASLALDAQGYLHVAYSTYPARDLKYARKHVAEGGWVIETADTAGSVGWWPSLAVDAQGNPCVSYYDWTTGDLKYASKSSGTWTTQVVDSTGDVGKYTSLALDAQGNPHITYYDATKGDLKYASRNGEIWTVEVVAAEGDVGLYTSLALDGDGNPHVSFYDGHFRDAAFGDASVHLQSPVGGERWEVGSSRPIRWSGSGAVEVFISNDGGATYSWAASSKYNSAIINMPSWDTDYARVKITRAAPYSSSISGVFSIYPPPEPTSFFSQVVAASIFQGEYTSLRLDGQGRPHISYKTWPYAGPIIKYSYRTDSGWCTETVDSGSYYYCYGTSLVLDAQDRPHIGYSCNSSPEYPYVKYAYRDGGVWTTEIVDSTDTHNGGDALDCPSLALDAQGNAYMCYHHDMLNSLEYARRIIEGGEYQWISETLETGGAGEGASLALDRRGDPHISYTKSDTLKYISGAGGVWTAEVVSIATCVPTSLALDAGDNPHIAYRGPNEDLMYTYRSGEIWVSEVVDTVASGYWGGMSLALDAQGSPHISYMDGANNDLKYAHKVGGIWVTEFVDAQGSVGWYNSLAIDQESNAHISYMKWTGSTLTDLKFADSGVDLVSPAGGEHWEAGSRQYVRWTGLGTVDVLISADAGASYAPAASSVGGGVVAVDVPWWDTDHARVKIVREEPYASSSSSLFSIDTPPQPTPFFVQTVDAADDVGKYASLRLDLRGCPHISYSDETNHNLKYACWTDGSWSVATVDGAGEVGQYTSLCLDSQGNPHISYYDIAKGDLKYASWSGGSWSAVTVDSIGNVGYYTALGLDTQGEPSIAYFDVTNNCLKYAHSSSGTWNIETVDLAGSVGMYVSLALDAQGTPHISYYDMTHENLKYAHKTSGTWSTEIIDSAHGVGLFTSLVVDAQGKFHISYYDLTHQDLKYAYGTAGTWNKEIIDATGAVGLYTSLSMDAQGVPHVTYYDSSNGWLRHAYKANENWTTEVVDAAIAVGLFSSLAIDAQGYPRVAYYDATNGNLKYASAAIHLTQPTQGTVWPVGALRAVTWQGVGAVDVWLSVDGGMQYDLLGSGATGGIYGVVVPHTPSRYCRIKLERATPLAVSVSDSFFTIETSVELLQMSVSYRPQDSDGAVISWRTQPGPEDLAGYRLDRARGDSPWVTLVPLTREVAYHDRDATAGTRYRVFAINGLKEELLLGECSIAPSAPLSAGPIPYVGGTLAISYATASGPGGVPDLAEVALFDVTGRLVRTIDKGVYPAGMRKVEWDGLNSAGETVPTGVYFLRSVTGNHREEIKVLVLR